MTTGETIALTRWTFVGKVMSLLFNRLSRLVITFLSWTVKKAECRRIGALELWLKLLSQEKTLESPLDCKEIQSVHLEANQS